MKRTKKLICFLLSAVMVLALIGTALALTDGDPNECPYCGIGTYISETSREWVASDHLDTRMCIEHGSPYEDWYMRYTYLTRFYCTYSGCRYYVPEYGRVYRYMWVCKYPPVVEVG